MTAEIIPFPVKRKPETAGMVVMAQLPDGCQIQSLTTYKGYLLALTTDGRVFAVSDEGKVQEVRL